MPQSNRRSWQKFEDAIEALHRKLHPQAIVKRNDRLPGRNSGGKRQVDVSLRYRLGPTEILIIVEAKRHGRKIDVEELSAFVAKKNDVGAHVGIMVAERGFTRGARNLADREGIKMYTLRDTLQESWPGDISVKFFVEAATLHVIGWAILDSHGKPIEVPDRVMHLFDSKQPDQEITFDDLLAELWKKGGKIEGEQNVAVSGHSGENSKGGIANSYTIHISFRAEIARFARDATLELLGLTDATEGTTHTDAFSIVTKPGATATFYSDPDFWQKLPAPFAMILKTCVVVFPHTPGDSNKQKLLKLLQELEVKFSAQAGKTPISLRLD